MVRLRDRQKNTDRLADRQTDRSASSVLKKEPPLLMALRLEEGGFGRLKVTSFECRAEGQDQIDGDL